MTPEERRLITELFERMRGFGAPEKDREAEALIAQSVRAMPDAPYMLVQSVLVQEQALQQAGQRIDDLEQRVRELEGGEARASGSGSFLGGLLGGGRPAGETRAASVPQVGARATAPVWGGDRAAGAPAVPPPQAAQPASGGFMRTAMTTAAGVAGGMLLADGIRNMMGGANAGQPGKAAAAGADAASVKPAETPATAEEPLYNESDRNDRSTYDEASDDGGADFGGGDIEI